MVLPLAGYLYVGIQSAYAQAVEDTNPRANYWRAVRDGVEGYSATTGRTSEGRVINTETDVLLQGTGQNWRQIRNGLVANYGGWILFLLAIVILFFFAWRGRVLIEGGRSGKLIRRWSNWDRIIHWYTAILFVVLAVTGLSMLFGRAVLIPLLGPQGFSAWADISIGLHNYLGPFFSIGVLAIIITWIRYNIPRKGDGAWLARAGGMFSKDSKEHPPAGRMNAGEKIWFWIICTVGVTTIVTGFILDFWLWDQTRSTMQLSNLIHGVAALVWIGVWFGHFYLGTIGTEGALEGMTSGYVDVNWMKQHHNLWYEELQKKGVEVKEAPPAPARPSGPGEQPA